MNRPSVTMLRDPDQVIDALSPVRRKILSALAEPDSATGVARRLGSTRQKVNYHLHALEEAGLVEVAELRPRRGLTERIMRRTSDVVLVDPIAFDPSGSTQRDAAGLSAVVATATDLIRQAAQVTVGVGASGERIAAASLDTEIRVAGPAALKTMIEEIAAVIARYDTRDNGLLLRVATTVLPAIEPS